MTFADRHRLRESFNEAAETYQQARPEYPTELFDVLVDVTGVDLDSALLEIGCATGKATLPLARRGYQITAIDSGRNLVAAAGRNLARYPRVHIVNAAFETWSPGAGERFDLVYAATAWHWINPVRRYQRAWELLRPGKHLAFWAAQHVIPENGDPFLGEIQEVYESIGATDTDGRRPRRPGTLGQDTEEINSSGLFQTVSVSQFDWEISYTAEEYIALLNTFSGHITMEPERRNYLYSEIRRRLDRRADGTVRRHWGAVLHVARRIEHSHR